MKWINLFRKGSNGGLFEHDNECPWASQRWLCPVELGNVTDSLCTRCRFRFCSEFLTPVTSLRPTAFETGNHKMCKQKYQTIAISVPLPSGAIMYNVLATLCLVLHIAPIVDGNNLLCTATEADQWLPEGSLPCPENPPPICPQPREWNVIFCA
jgi:hypothetical protein